MIAQSSFDDDDVSSIDHIIIQVTGTAVCGTDLCILDGYVPQMEYGDVLGHEYIGHVVHSNTDLAIFERGDRVVVPAGIFNFPEYRDLFNRDPDTAKYHIRVQPVDYSLMKIPPMLSDEQILLLADIYPAARMAIENAEIGCGDIVAVHGSGIMSQMIIQYAWMRGAKRVIVLDHNPKGLRLAQQARGTEIVDLAEQDSCTALLTMTGKGPDCYIETTDLQDTTRRGLQDIINCCRIGGRIALPASYRSHMDKIPIGAALGKKLTLKIGRAKNHKSLSQLLAQIEDGYLDVSFIHTLFPQDEVPYIYELPTGKNIIFLSRITA